ncbi:MAG: restriction endonuclease subunit S [Saprospiraceae bacterium]
MSKKNQNRLVPEFRFSEFKDVWETEQLSNLLDYERPDNYIVKDTNYISEGTPVLTANKSFILGYTQERFGICNDIPAIIFDDFTVDKKFVDFPFKVKSSAIKILRPKGKNDLKFIFELMSLIRFEAKEHKRYYISAYQNLSVPIPKPNEQNRIAACLTSLDQVITDESKKLEVLKAHKKGLLQHLFPQEGETVPRVRFKEFEGSGEWVVKTLIDTANKKVKWSFTGGPFGSNLMASDYTSSGFRIIQLQNIGDGVFNDDNKIYASLEKADELLSCNIYAGDIIISKMGDPVGRACIIPDNLHRCIMASDGIRLVVDEEKYSKYFIYSLINSKRVREAIEKRATGSTRKRIGLDTLREIELIVPKSQKEQKKIANTLSSIDDLINTQGQKLQALQLHKKGLLQGLFPNLNEITE